MSSVLNMRKAVLPLLLIASHPALGCTISTSEFTTLADQCAPNVAGTTLASVVMPESSLDNLAVHDTTTGAAIATEMSQSTSGFSAEAEENEFDLGDADLDEALAAHSELRNRTASSSQEQSSTEATTLPEQQTDLPEQSGATSVSPEAIAPEMPVPNSGDHAEAVE